MSAHLTKRDPVRLFFKRLGILALLTLVALAISGVWNVYQKERESRALRSQAETQLQEYKKEEAHLSAQVASLRTVRGQEAMLREQYGVGRDGEGLVIIVDPAEVVPIQASSTFMRWFQQTFSWF